jgi:hypothetical protein
MTSRTELARQFGVAGFHQRFEAAHVLETDSHPRCAMAPSDALL